MFPSATHAAWMAERMLRWGHFGPDVDVAAAAAACTQSRYFREAAASLGIACPADDFPPMPLRNGGRFTVGSLPAEAKPDGESSPTGTPTSAARADRGTAGRPRQTTDLNGDDDHERSTQGDPDQPARLPQPQMRAFHMSWFAFFLCFFAWFGIAPLMTVVRAEMGLTKDQVGW